MLKAVYKYLLAVHLNPFLIYRSIKALPSFWRDRAVFAGKLSSSDWPQDLYPILLDRNAQSANLGEYFWQDLYVAKRIIEANPDRHIDVGSRVDGFIAHLACVRSVEIFDIRPLKATIDNVIFHQWDLTEPRIDKNGIADCVSCLHTLEHVGLGRYGDPLDPDGWKKALASLAALVNLGGALWLSVPIGVQRVEFNAHRVFAPNTIRDEAARSGLAVREFHYYSDQKLFHSKTIDEDMKRLGKIGYGLGIFYLEK